MASSATPSASGSPPSYSKWAMVAEGGCCAYGTGGYCPPSIYHPIAYPPIH